MRREERRSVVRAARHAGVLGLVASLAWLSPPALDSAPVRSAAGADMRCDLGILSAFTGDLGGAESAFVALLSASPRDARALTNLGNVALLRGNLDLALAFYDRAALADTADGGIRLNRAIALSLLGDDDASRVEAHAGIRLAGDHASAGSLLGLRPEADAEEARGAPSHHLTREEVRKLLRAAIPAVTLDSLRAGARPAGPSRAATRHRAAGTRASGTDDPNDACLYWKR